MWSRVLEANVYPSGSESLIFDDRLCGDPSPLWSGSERGTVRPTVTLVRPGSGRFGHPWGLSRCENFHKEMG